VKAHPLMTALDQVGDSAAVLTSGVVAPVIPGLEIEGLGAVPLPASPDTLKAIRKLASRAPYGRGLETVVDLEVRKVWQIEADQVRLTNPDWAATTQEVLERVAEDLQISGKIEASFYKLLLYEPGGFFAHHRDSEKAERMFATLVICLPTAHQGGELVVEHEGRVYQADFSQHSAFRVQFAAFYADCLHEVKPVTDGHRLCLVYNLCLRAKIQPRPPQLDQYIKRTASELAQLVPATLEKLVVQLSHEYTAGGLSVEGLKGGDRARWELLWRAAQSLNLNCHLGSLDLYQEGIAEEEYNRRRRSGTYYMDEVLEQTICVRGLVDQEGQKAWRGSMAVDESELLLRAPLEKLAFRRSIHEATGNEGVTMERRYRTAVAVVWSKDDLDQLVADQGPRSAVPRLRERLEQKQPAEALAQAILDKWKRPPYGLSENSRSSSRRMLICLRHLRNPSLILRFLSQIFPIDFNGSEGRPLVRLAEQMGWKELSEPLLAFFENAEALDDLGRIWRGYLRIFHDLCCLPPAVSAERRELIPQLATVLWKREQGWLLGLRYRRDREGYLEWWIPALTVANPQLLANVLEQYSQEDLHKVLLPSLDRLQNQRSLAGYQQLWTTCLGQLEARLAIVPSAPADWAREGSAGCSCEDCGHINQFMKSPSRASLRFQAPEKRRKHLGYQFGRCDLNFRTEKTHPALTLVLTKNQNSYERAVKQRAEDQAHLAHLREIAP